MTRQSTITDHLPGSPAAESAAIDARIALAATPTTALMRAAYALTHQIHSTQMGEGGTPKDRGIRAATVAGLRAQRDLIDAEVLRRTGDAR